MEQTKRNTLLIGAAATDITPELPDWIIGVGKAFVTDNGHSFEWSGRDEPTNTVHDPLTMQALYIEQDGERALVLSADLLFPLGAERVIEAAARAASVEPDAVFYAATHNHNGPVETDAYIERLVERAASCAAEAKAHACPSVVDHAWDTYDRLIYDRSAPWGPVDGRIDVLRFQHATTGRPIAFLMSYGCHPCSLSYDWNAVTADYPGVARRHVQTLMQTAVPVMFLTGCAANVQMIGVKKFEVPRMYLNVPKGDFEAVERLGTILAECAVAALKQNGKPVQTSRLEVGQKVIELPIVFEATQAELQERREQITAMASHSASGTVPPWKKTLERVYGDMIDQAIDLASAPQPKRPIDTGFLILGDFALIATPLELTWQMGVRVRDDSPYPVTISATTTFGYDGYLTERRFYEQERENWNYEAMGMTAMTGYVPAAEAPDVLHGAILAQLNAMRQPSRTERTHKTSAPCI